MSPPRSPLQRCAQCAFYLGLHGGRYGECRKNPPVVFIVDGIIRESFPRPVPTDWCGAFTPEPVEVAA